MIYLGTRRRDHLLPLREPCATNDERVDCAVIMVTYNSAKHVEAALDSLKLAANGLTLRVIVVDNCSFDGTLELVRDYADIICVDAGRNAGYAGGINIGRGYAGAFDSLLMLNPDVRLAPGSLREMFNTLQDPYVGVVVPMLLGEDGECFPSLRRDPTLMRAAGDCLLGGHWKLRPAWLGEMVWPDSEYAYPHSVEWATGAAWLISRACDQAVGEWDERFFLYSEETDYANRTRECGFRLEYQPSAQVEHSGGGSGRSDALVALHAVNRIRYMEKYGRWSHCYRMIVIFHELLRSKNSAHRSALCAVLRRSRWASIVANLQTVA